MALERHEVYGRLAMETASARRCRRLGGLTAQAGSPERFWAAARLAIARIRTGFIVFGNGTERGSTLRRWVSEVMPSDIV